jgi:D-serine deaminase-like pyridoxal phosphate-dependent protein
VVWIAGPLSTTTIAVQSQAMTNNTSGTRKGISRRSYLRSVGALTTAGVVGTAASPNVLASRGAIRNVDDLDTPAVVVDLDVLEKNIRGTQAVCHKANIPLQVHIKTHKIPEIAHMQLREGAVGICCQKLGEAEVMVNGGVRGNILVPYNIVGTQKLVRLARLCKRADMTVAVDSETTAKGISDQLQKDGTSIRVLVELDTGGKRTGVQSPQAAVELAQKVSKLPSLELRGVMTYPSRLATKPFFDETVDLFRKAGLSIDEISGGGTGSEVVSKQIGCTVTRSGSYIFEGLRRIGGSNPPNAETCATRMIVTVVSTPTPDRIIIDAGQKTFQSRPSNPYGHIVEAPDAKIYGMSVEHGHVDVSGSSHKFRVGERLSVVPQHQGMTINLHSVAYAVRKGLVEAVWPVAGRGQVQ